MLDAVSVFVLATAYLRVKERGARLCAPRFVISCGKSRTWHNAHSLRHRYATTTYAATHDLLLVSKLLGHASVETTQRYIAMPDERLRAAVAATRLAA